MKRFAIIQHGKVHQIIEALIRPEFAPYIHLIEITDPLVQEGWGYDQHTGKCYGPKIVEMQAIQSTIKQPYVLPSVEEYRKVGSFTVEGVLCFGNIALRRFMLKAGENIPGHTHNFDHVSILGCGKVAVEIVEGAEHSTTVYEAPVEIILRKDVAHRIHALSDVVWYCIFAVRDKNGDAIEEYASEQDPVWSAGIPNDKRRIR